jgi:hypothetical protein
VADLSLLTSATGQTPTLSTHLTTKDYVDTTHNQVSLNTVTGATTLSLSVEMLRVNASTGVTITVPLNSAVAFPIGSRRWVRRVGTANVSVVGAGGVTINWPAGAFILTTQYAMAEVVKVGTDTWDGVLIGN